MVVIFFSLTNFFINELICLPMIGSRPVVGSSKIKISGLLRMALASPILFEHQ